MASAFSHAIAASAITAAFYRPNVPKSVWIAGIVCSVLPDLDVIGFRFGVHYSDFWGHRGFTHSLIFAALLAAVLAAGILRTQTEIYRVSLSVYLFLSTASHGLLDAITNGGLGVAFFSPFNNERCFLPWRPIRVSPIGVSRFFSARGLAVLKKANYCGSGFLPFWSSCSSRPRGDSGLWNQKFPDREGGTAEGGCRHMQ